MERFLSLSWLDTVLSKRGIRMQRFVYTWQSVYFKARSSSTPRRKKLIGFKTFPGAPAQRGGGVQCHSLHGGVGGRRPASSTNVGFAWHLRKTDEEGIRLLHFRCLRHRGEKEGCFYALEARVAAGDVRPQGGRAHYSVFCYALSLLCSNGRTPSGCRWYALQGEL